MLISAKVTNYILIEQVPNVPRFQLINIYQNYTLNDFNLASYQLKTLLGNYDFFKLLAVEAPKWLSV